MELFGIEIRFALQWGVLAVLCVFAFLRGDAPEKLCAIGLASLPILDWPYHAVVGSARYSNVDLGHFVIDLIAFAIFASVAVRANRNYPLCLAGFQLMAVLSHVVRAMSYSVGRVTYAVLIIAPSYLMLVVMAIGLTLHIRRVKRHGPYRAWRSS